MNPYQQRRQELLAQIEEGVVILFATRSKTRNADCDFPFRQDSHFFYLTGFDEPDAILVLSKRSNGESTSYIFVEPKDPMKEQWSGYVLGVEKACEALGVDRSFAIDSFDKELPHTAQRAHLYLYRSLLQTPRFVESQTPFTTIVF